MVLLETKDFDEYHLGFMRLAIDKAKEALKQNEVPVGCVFVHNGRVIAEGMNDTNRSLNGTRHAEFVALNLVLAKYDPRILEESDLYVTVEPCIMCASALRQLGLRAVYYGCTNDRFGGTGGVLSIHTDVGIDRPYSAFGGLYRAEAIMLLRQFYIQENANAPEPRPKRDRQLNTVISALKDP